MQSYEQLIAGPYNSEECLSSFKTLLEDPTNEEKILKAWEHAMPILGCVLNSQFSWMSQGTELYDEALSSGAIKLWNLLRSEKFHSRYYVNDDTHFAFLFGICRLEIITVLNKLRRHSDVPPFTTQSSLDSSPTSILFKIYAKELPQQVLEYVDEHIRFDGSEKRLCMFIAERLVGDHEIPTPVIRKQWGTKHLAFYQDYVRVLIRSALWEFKQQFHMMRSASDDAYDNLLANSLQDVFGEGMHVDGSVEPYEQWWNLGMEKE